MDQGRQTRGDGGAATLCCSNKGEKETLFNHGDDERLTFKTRSLAEEERRIRSHQAGHLVFMYCFP